MTRIYSFLLCFILSLSAFCQSGVDIKKSSYFMFRNSDSAFYYANKVMNESKDSSSFYNGKFLFGRCIFWQGHIDSSLTYINSAESFFQRSKDTVMLLKIFSEKGNILKVLSKYDKSYDYLMKALTIAQSMDSLRWQTVITIQLAEHARAMGNKENALELIDRAFNLNDNKLLNGDDLADLYDRKAAIEQEFGSSDNAKAYSQMSLKASVASGNLHQQATSYNELGYYYGNHRLQGAKQNDEAMEYYHKAEDLWKKLNFKRYYIWVWRNIASELGKNQQYAESNTLLEKTLSIAEMNHWDEVASDVSSQLAGNFETLHKTDSALFYYKKLIEHRTATEAKVKNSAFQDMLVKYATQQKEQLLKKQQIETMLAKKENAKTTSQRNFILLLLAILLMLFCIITFLTISVRRKNNLLFEGSRKIDIINKQLQSELNQKNILLAELHHRVKNNLAILSGLINLQKDAVIDATSRDILTDIQNRIFSIAMIHRNLYGANDTENVDFEKYLKELSSSLIETYKKKKEKINCSISLQNVKVNINQAVPLALIMNELISNSLKHAFQNSESGKIGISGHMENSCFHLHVYDDGPGFMIDFNNLPSSSLGLQLVKILAEQLDAEFYYRFKEGKSEFTFLIPIKD